MTDLYLERVQAFTTNNCFGRSITSWNYIIYAHHELEKKNPYVESNFEISTEG